MAYVSLMPVAPESGLGGTPARRWINNALHVPAYAVLAALWLAALGGPLSARRAVAAAVAAAAFGALMELGQVFVPGRFGGLDDVALNTLGAVVGVVSVVLAPRWLCNAGDPVPRLRDM